MKPIVWPARRLRLHFGGQVLSVQDLGAFGRVVVDQVVVDLLAGQERHAELLDFEAAGHVAERGRLGIVGADGQAETDDGEHHVAGPGDVVDLPRPRRQQLGAAIGAHQRHSVAVERDEHGLHLEISTSFWPTRIASSARPIVIPVASWASSRFGVMQCTPR